MTFPIPFEYPRSTPAETLAAADTWDALADQQHEGIAIGVVDPICGGHRIRTYRECARELRATVKEG